MLVAHLSPEQRLVFSRLFAAWFENYCRDEGANLRRGRKLTAAFAKMGRIRRFSSLTCDDFGSLCERYLAFNGGKPFHDPFAVEAVMGAA